MAFSTSAIPRPLVSHNHVYLSRGHVYVNLSAAGVNHHVNLALIHGDGYPPGSVGIIAQLLQLFLHAAGGLSRPGKVVSGHYVMEMHFAHLYSQPPLRPFSYSFPQA